MGRRIRSSLRKVPVQERSRRRLDAIVAAAAELFAEAGFEATTTEAIAARARTSIGSLYQFFPNKLAVFRAVAERCLERTGEVFAEIFSAEGAPVDDLGALIDTSVDAFAALQEREPAFKAIIANLQLYGEYEEADAEMSRQFAAVVEALLAARAPKLEAARRPLVATTLVQTTGALLVLTARGGDPRVLGELKRMLRRYIEPELD
ncbi:MAG: TetR/AcrR family transcriptional regulator [Nannocystaceae bacterium]